MTPMVQSWLFILIGLPLAAFGVWLLYRLDKTPGFRDQSVGSFSRAWSGLPRVLMMMVLGIFLLFLGMIVAGLGISDLAH